MRPTIEYLNRRRDGKAASGGKTYSRLVNPVDLRAADLGKDAIDKAHDTIIAIFDEFRSFMRESDRKIAASRLSPEFNSDETIPF